MPAATSRLGHLHQRPQDFLELVERGKRGRSSSTSASRPAWQDLPDAGGGARPAEARRRRGGRLRRDARPRRDRRRWSRASRSSRAAQSNTAASPSRRWTSTRVLARKPQVAIVDELAHTNVPGCRNRKRYQDVLELLDAGINVIGAFNIQHLESLERPGRARHRRGRPRDRPDTLPQAGRPGGEPRPGGGGPARAAARGQDLPRRRRSPGRWSTSSSTTTSPPCASWRCARWPRASSARPPQRAPASGAAAQPGSGG